ncbi:MAG: hypothetical protein J6R83_00950 [Clostridia bacterium]|nr:hypothetical protein [Clostridia bacterium]
MKKYLLPNTGKFYKANMHCHTTCSDGKSTPAEIKELYQKLGFSIVAYTDHDSLIPHHELTDENFVALTGAEIGFDEEAPAGTPYSDLEVTHINIIALEKDTIYQPGWNRTLYQPHHPEMVQFDENEPDFIREQTPEGISRFMKLAKSKGFFVVYNHPNWSKENAIKYMQYEGLDAVEIINGSDIVGGYDGYTPHVLDDYSDAGRRVFAVAGDDNHSSVPYGDRRSNAGTAYTMIKADKLEYREITKALEKGDFYCSEGPEIHELYMEDDKIHVKCSDAYLITCVYGTRLRKSVYGTEENPVNEAVFDFPEKQKNFRIVVQTKDRKHACTNVYFYEDVMK